MRRVHAIFALLSAGVPAFAGTRLTAPYLTVVLDFKGSFNQTAVTSMKREASDILAPAGMRLDWPTPSTAADASFADLVLIWLSSRSGATAPWNPNLPPLNEELGPLAIAGTANGPIQPLGEVGCGFCAVGHVGRRFRAQG